MDWLVKDRALVFVASARALALRTAQCIALCCAGCPGPVLRRKCDRWCPTTGQLSGFYRIDLNAFVSPGVTWAQWIAQHDAELTPCALIRFGNDPEQCYVLDRNCSRCFWNTGCNYVLNYAGLPVVPFTNPQVAQCRDCIQCQQCCDSATMLDCFGLNTCRECGSSYRTSYQYNGYTSKTIRGANNSRLLDTEITIDHHVDGRNDCIATNDQCNATQMNRTQTGYRSVHIHKLTQTVPVPVYTDYEANLTDPTYWAGPSTCGVGLSVFDVLRNILAAFEVNSLGWSGNTTPEGIASARNIVNMLESNGLLTLVAASILNGQCNGSKFIQFGGPFSGLYTNDIRWTWSVSVGAGGATVDLSYSHQNYTIPSNTRILNVDINSTCRATFQITKVNDCAPNAAGGCADLLAHTGGSHGNTNGRTTGELIG